MLEPESLYLHENLLLALARSMGKVCAVTALAAQVYGEEEEFTTAHDLFGIPVIEDNEDIDHEARGYSFELCQTAKKTCSSIRGTTNSLGRNSIKS